MAEPDIKSSFFHFLFSCRYKISCLLTCRWLLALCMNMCENIQTKNKAKQKPKPKLE